MGVGRDRLRMNMNSLEHCQMYANESDILDKIFNVAKDNRSLPIQNGVYANVKVDHLTSSTDNWLFAVYVTVFDEDSYNEISSSELISRFGSITEFKAFIDKVVTEFIDIINDADITFKYLDRTDNSDFIVQNGKLYAPIYDFAKELNLETNFEMKDYHLTFEMPDIDKIVNGILKE